jgi:heme/copper-type cytochrome/quinol oxidase subunit 2
MTNNELVITIMIFFIIIVVLFVIGLIKRAGREAPHPDEPKYCYKAKCEKEDE